MASNTITIRFSKQQLLWEALVKAFASCKKCLIGEYASKKVFGRGSLLPEIMFIGEAPGKTEDMEGQPFVGLAGALLEVAIGRANKKKKKIFITNTVSCRPCDGIGQPNRAPNQEEVHACAYRLHTTLLLLKPKRLILLGKVAQANVLQQKWASEYETVCLEHPAYILRKGGIKSEQFKTFVNKLTEAMK